MKERIREIMDEVLAHRRYLHAHPEPSHQERETAAYIAAELRKEGII